MAAPVSIVINYTFQNTRTQACGTASSKTKLTSINIIFSFNTH